MTTDTRHRLLRKQCVNLGIASYAYMPPAERVSLVVAEAVCSLDEAIGICEAAAEGSVAGIPDLSNELREVLDAAIAVLRRVSD